MLCYFCLFVVHMSMLCMLLRKDINDICCFIIHQIFSLARDWSKHVT